MEHVEDNLDECFAEIDGFLDSIGFDMPGESEGTVGEEIARAVAEDIHASDAVNPDGSPWPENDPEYKNEKRRTHGSDTTGYRSGQMLSKDSLYGQPEIGHDEMTMVYGTGTVPSHGYDGLRYDAKEDGKVTDREKAEYFAKIGEFYAMNEKRDAEVGDLVGKAVARQADRTFS